jgi:integrase
MEAAHRTALAKGEVGIKTRPTCPSLEQFVPGVMEEIRKNCSEHPRTAEFYEDAFNRALSFEPLAKSRLRNITPELLSRFTTSQLKEVAPATVNRSLAAVRRAMYLAQEWELIDRVPKFRMLDGERHREFVLSGKLRDRFIAGLPQPARNIAQFLVNTGMRISECCALTWDRVFADENGQAHIYVDRGKTKRARRHIPLTKEARAILDEQKRISRSKYVFVRFGQRVRRELWYTAPVSRHTVSSQFRERRDELGLPWDAVLHSTRHTALTDLGAAGADAFTIQAFAGHSSVTTSQRYVHPVSETMFRAVEKLDAFREQVARKEHEAATLSATPDSRANGEVVN